jgi:hypothetical protein
LSSPPIHIFSFHVFYACAASKSEEEWETDDEESGASKANKPSLIRKTPDTTFSVSLEQASAPTDRNGLYQPRFVCFLIRAVEAAAEPNAARGRTRGRDHLRMSFLS